MHFEKYIMLTYIWHYTGGLHEQGVHVLMYLQFGFIVLKIIYWAVRMRWFMNEEKIWNKVPAYQGLCTLMDY